MQIAETARNLMETMKRTFEQAMENMKVPADQRTTIAGMVNKK